MSVQLFKKRCIWLPSITGTILIFLFLLILLFSFLRLSYNYLSINEPLNTKLLVVENWVPAYAYNDVLDLFQEGDYEMILITGTDKTNSWCAGTYEYAADFMRSKFIISGIDSTIVIAIPGEVVDTDRTFSAAIELKSWLNHQESKYTGINLVTIGPHARRSRYVYQKALGSEWQTGIIALKDQNYDKKYWYHTSRGFRSVVGEWIAWIFVFLTL